MTENAKRTLLKDKTGMKLLPITDWDSIIGEASNQAVMNAGAHFGNRIIIDAEIPDYNDTYTNGIIITDPKLDVDVNNGTQQTRINFRDKNKVLTSVLYHEQSADGSTGPCLIGYNADRSKNGLIRAGVSADGLEFTYLKGMAEVMGTSNSLGARITSQKDSAIFLACKSATATFGATRSASIYPSIEFQDKNGARTGRVEYVFNADGSHQINLIDKKSATEGTYCSISAGFDKNGNWFTKAPTPTVSDDSTKIATTAWVKDQPRLVQVWESGWVSVADSASYSWNVSSAGMSASTANKIVPEILGKVVTADGNYAVNDVVYGQWSNYVGSSSNREMGYSLTFTGSTLMFSAGNDANWTAVKKGGGKDNLLTANVQYKIILRRYS